MRIAANPKWTFTEAVQAAWDAYRGGPEYGATNRIRVLEQWANVVGRDRARSELESILNHYGGIKAASVELGLSTYAIRKLRRGFNEMPTVTPHVSVPSTFHEFLRRLAELDDEPEISIIVQAVPLLASFLGYAESEVYFDVNIGVDSLQRADVIFAPGGVSAPYLLIEVTRSTHDRQFLEHTIKKAEHYRNVAGAPSGMVLSPQHLVVLSNASQRIYALPALTATEAGDIQSALRRPSFVQTTRPNPPAPASAQLQDLLEKVSSAQTNDQKKKTLEDLAASTFDAHEFIRCKYRNLRTRSSEIDIVCEVVGTERDMSLREYGRYFLVECKNWAAPAGAREIRDFLGKLRKSRVRLGIYFSRNGITGEQHGTDALREIHSAYDQNEICIVVVSEQDLTALQHVQDVLEVVEEKLDAIRFDF